MQLAASVCVHFGLVFVALIVDSDAFRMSGDLGFASEKIDTLADVFQPEVDSTLEDITNSIAVVDSAGHGRCCCDASQAGTHVHTRRGQERSGACIFFPVRMGAYHCSDLGRSARPWQTGKLHHYTRTEGQRCLIRSEEVAQAALDVQNLHPTPDYCREVLPVASLSGSSRRPLVAVPAAPLGGAASVSCASGHEPVEAVVTCVIDKVGEGTFSPQPTCRRVGDWCAEMQEDSFRVVGAGVGQSRTVACAESMTPQVALVTCGHDGIFHPAPACVAAASYDVTIRAAEVEATGAAKCCCDADHRHFTSVSRWLTGSTEHTGACLFVFEVSHCREVEGRNHWVHYRRSVDGRCVVDESEYQRLNDAYPPPRGWSREAERLSN